MVTTLQTCLYSQMNDQIIFLALGWNGNILNVTKYVSGKRNVNSSSFSLLFLMNPDFYVCVFS